MRLVLKESDGYVDLELADDKGNPPRKFKVDIWALNYLFIAAQPPESEMQSQLNQQTGEEYFAMTAQQQYDLNEKVRDALAKFGVITETPLSHKNLNEIRLAVLTEVGSLKKKGEPAPSATGSPDSPKSTGSTASTSTPTN